MWKEAREALRNILAGVSEDHVNPQKRLERRYLYFAILALKYRQLRIDCPDLSDEEHQERARSELEANDSLDQTSNVELRQMLQDSLHPQIHGIFDALERVDQTMDISWDEDESTEGYSSPLDRLDWSRYVAMLQTEYDETPSFSSGAKPTFQTRKREALELLLEFHNRSNNGAQTRKEPEDGLDAFGINVSKLAPSSIPSLRQYQTLNLCRSILMRQELGFSILCLQSLIPNAGRGVFCDGSATTGSLVALQPGEVWPKEHLLTSSPDVMRHFAEENDDEDCLVSLRFDEYVVDSRQSPVTVLTRPGYSNNLFALGHMINHANPPLAPNCQSTMVNFTERLHLNPDYLCNVYAREPTWRSKFFDREPMVMHGLGLMAKRDVVNEELLYDYRLQSESTPDWYQQAAKDDENDDLEQVVFFRDDWRASREDK